MFLIKLFLSFINGQRKLWVAWWLTWVLPLMIINVLLISTSAVTTSAILFFTLLGLSWFFTVFGAVSSWQCSNNCKSRGWSITARLLIVIGPFLHIARLTGEHPEITLNMPLMLSLFGIICMGAVWYFHKKNQPGFFNHKHIMSFVILIVYSMLFVGQLIAQYRLQTNTAVRKEFAAVNKKLPILLSKGTLLTKIYLDNHTINYQLRLIEAKAGDTALNNDIIGKARSELIQKACNSSTKQLLSNGFNLSYNYVDKNHKSIANITVNKANCVSLSNTPLPGQS